MDCSLLPGGPQRHFVRCRPKSEARPLCLCCLLTSPPLPASPTFTSETQASLETACLGMSPASATTSQGPGQSNQPTRHSRGRELCVSANSSVPSQAWHKTRTQQGLSQRHWKSSLFEAPESHRVWDTAATTQAVSPPGTCESPRDRAGLGAPFPGT